MKYGIKKTLFQQIQFFISMENKTKIEVNDSTGYTSSAVEIILVLDIRMKKISACF